MLRQRLIHPEILAALASAGQGARVLIVDGNYPSSTRIGEFAALVYLGFAPGKPTVTEVLDVLLSVITVEDAIVIDPDSSSDPPVFQEFRRLMPDMPLTRLSRFEFYEDAGGPDTCLQIVTGDTRSHAALLLVLGSYGS